MPLQELGDVVENAALSHHVLPEHACPEIALVSQMCIFVKSPTSESFHVTEKPMEAFAFIGSGESLGFPWMLGAWLLRMVKVYGSESGDLFPAESQVAAIRVAVLVISKEDE